MPFMPGWVSMFYGVAYFLAMVPTALYPYIFCGPELLLPFCKVDLYIKRKDNCCVIYQKVTSEEELLIEDEIVEEDGFESTHV